ncbi:MAG: indole-3-glycerol phosphate synthase TrpC [Gemmatimonadaceae bacterium]|nr:indole-3-glycerol phosphate synthase TrpC [Chitinophagaceae bacterium]
MDILETIVAYKRKEVEARKSATSMSSLEAKPYFNRGTYSLKANLLNADLTGIIAEFKRKSPSKGVIHPNPDIISITEAYTKNGAAGLSILTDEHFFGGHDTDIDAARTNQIPILRKEFIIDEYQIAEARAIGADAILLIAACLSPAEVKSLSRTARDLGLEVLLELHDESELDHISPEIEMIGINNRNLKTFVVDIDRSLKMANLLSKEKIKIAESGISKPETVQLFRNHGFRGFLMGENFMKENDPGKAFADFVAKN